MIYVPAGRTIYGSSDDEATRSFLSNQPAHDVDVGAFLIARTEVTVADYIAYLRVFPGSERTRLRPKGLTLTADGAIAWKLRTRTLAPGEPYCNPVGPCVNWSLLPLDNGAGRTASTSPSGYHARGDCREHVYARIANGSAPRGAPTTGGIRSATAIRGRTRRVPSLRTAATSSTPAPASRGRTLPRRALSG